MLLAGAAPKGFEDWDGAAPKGLDEPAAGAGAAPKPLPLPGAPNPLLLEPNVLVLLLPKVLLLLEPNPPIPPPNEFALFDDAPKPPPPNGVLIAAGALPKEVPPKPPLAVELLPKPLLAVAPNGLGVEDCGAPKGLVAAGVAPKATVPLAAPNAGVLLAAPKPDPEPGVLVPKPPKVLLKLPKGTDG